MRTSSAIGVRVPRRSGSPAAACFPQRSQKSGTRTKTRPHTRRADQTQLTREQLAKKLHRQTRELNRARVALQKVIAARREIEDRLRLSLRELADLKSAFDEHAILAITDPRGRLTYVNDLFCSISGYTREELLGQDHRIVNSGHHPKKFFRELRATIGRGNVWKGEICNRAKDGSNHWVDTTIVPFLDGAGKPTQYVVIRSEITKRKQAEQELKLSLQEKETLLKETHHRVKNNLQLISSLLHMQANCIWDNQAKTAFHDSEKRIRSMALIHEKLYGADSLALVDFEAYVRSLAEMLVRTYRAPGHDLKLEFNLSPIHLNLETAIPLGLVLSELISNCLKHAFPDPANDVLRVNLARGPDQAINLSVADNGRGLPETVDCQHGESLGLRLISILTEQLHGKFTVKSGQGTEFTVTVFECKPKRPMPT